MEGTSNGEEPASWEELYNINLMPSEIFLKFRKEIQGFRVGVNLEDVQLVSKKIPVTKFLNLQVGVGHSFQLHATGWKWKLTTCLGGDGISRIRNKTSLGLCPGVDFRFGWRADYVLPEITGGVGSDEPLFNMKSGRLQASLDRIEAIFTHADEE
ncbi:uncharacterized protein LOC105161923 isoform X2 [Sesamum indicum]|uniref:Uncharacterized protein LOC105161923 isoform X2 n=1 Tax=Sesamum indicum TaxID=4182 RepID=A0A6I9T346_SESIN|nr:uncharacterized protein LOC105161923 isoform X2 [Sesamum indicum]